MSKRRRKTGTKSPRVDAAELNIMPFIDVFSVLTTFLLMSAVFMSFGIIKVQVPFFSNKKPEEASKPQRVLTLNLDLQKDKMELATSYSIPPVEEKTFTFTTDKTGIDELHLKLVELRTSSPSTDLVNFFVGDEVLYELMAEVMDAVKFRRKGDPEFTQDSKDLPEFSSNYLIEKIVMSSVVL